MWFLAPLVLGAFLLWVSRLADSQRTEVERVAGAVSRLSLGSVEQASGAGLHATRGRLVCEEPTSDPVTAEPAAHYRVRVTQTITRPWPDVEPPGPPLLELTWGDDLVMKDETGLAVVAVAQCDLRVGELDRRMRSPDLPPEVARFLSEHGVRYPRDGTGAERDHELIVEHLTLPPGTELTLVGATRADGSAGTPEGYRGRAKPRPRFVPEEGMRPIVTTLPFETLRDNEASDRASFYLLVRTGNVLGSLLVALGLGLGLWHLLG